MRPGPKRVVPLALAALGALACTRNPYVIGSVCPPAGADAGAIDPRCAVTTPKGTLVLDLGHSGASSLGPLPLATGDVPPALWLRGEHATSSTWPPESGTPLALGAGAPTPGLGAPFKDGTGAVGLPGAASAYVAGDPATGAVGVNDFALEVVLRAANGASFLDKRAGAIGWWLHEDAGGHLLLELGDGVASHAVTISATTTLLSSLTPSAWYHCLFWVSRGVAARTYCDGSESIAATPPALGSLDAPAALLAVGGGAASRLAHVELFSVPSGGLGDPTSWAAVSRRRFATLTGVYPSAAGGTHLPAAGLRPGEAYLDLQLVAGGPRQLYLVGADWPRIACRTDAADGTLVCGYLSEPARSRVVPSAATAWQPAGVVVAASASTFVDGEPRFTTVAPSATNGAHTVSIAGTAGVNQVLSFFVHRLTAARVGTSAGALGTAVFDIANGVLVSAPTGITATIEPWGGGVFRCSYAFQAAAGGPTTYALHLLDDAGNDTFAGAGAPTLEVAGLQVDVSLGYAASLLALDIQPADQLTFVGDDGNLPSSPSALVTTSVMLPVGSVVADQAIFNLNRGGMFGDQVQLYLRGDNSNVKFWGLNGPVTYWAFDFEGVPPLTDGATHVLHASWDASAARLVIDAAAAKQVPITSAPTAVLDHIDVGFSERSSGALAGLVVRFEIGAP